jgi:hypothetical protein
VTVAESLFSFPISLTIGMYPYVQYVNGIDNNNNKGNNSDKSTEYNTSVRKTVGIQVYNHQSEMERW